ncbi:hypothetical protein SAY86_027094 [Trapa natans]|uniref:Myb-like domain-containing protein n=1 Tax=Trapa natans TaxID=22666 RepID=A0AAN7KQ32_TRANT|nr:hypothetical protein SAY86_027094 [Trapa natans]
MPHRLPYSAPGTSLRRSPRFLQRNSSPDPPDPRTPRPDLGKKPSRSRRQLGNKSKESKKPQDDSGGQGISGFVLRRSSRLGVKSEKAAESAEKEEAKGRSPRLDFEVKEASRLVEKREVGARCCILALASSVDKRGWREADRGIQGVKRQREENASGSSQGWTKEQEADLQRAYLATKPTPSFWKKVSKLVPGKSAQECFDKFNSDLATPQPRFRLRTAKARTSLAEPSPLSASKILNPLKQTSKKSNRSKAKSHLVQRTVRQLLQKQSQSDQTTGVDLFSILEPNVDPSGKVTSSSCMFSTPETAGKYQAFLHNLRERSSSNSKKPLSRFHKLDENSKVLVSPPVLKPVKNRAMHEKYLDQLHCRESKRNAVSVGAKIENGLKINVVGRAAKEVLVSDARDAIHLLRDLRSNPGNDSCDLDDNCSGGDEDEDDANVDS